MNGVRIWSAGMLGTVVLGLGGVWLLLARVLVEGAPAAGRLWDAAGRSDLVAGVVLVLAAAAGIFAQVAFGLRDAVAAAQRAQRAAGRLRP